jgi:hypothetical protein
VGRPGMTVAGIPNLDAGAHPIRPPKCYGFTGDLIERCPPAEQKHRNMWPFEKASSGAEGA